MTPDAELVTAAPPMLLSRQPILDPKCRVRGYALRLRGDEGPAELSTARALLLGERDIGVGGFTRGLPAWVRVTREVLLSLDPLPLPVSVGAVVLELDASVRVDEELTDHVLALRASGHAVALHDYLPRPELAPLLPLVSHVKLDMAAYGPRGIAPMCERLQGAAAKVVVDNVTSPAQRDACVAAGVDLMQGFFFELPRRLEDVQGSSSSIQRLRGIVELPYGAAFEEVERAVAADPALTLRLMRFANSAAIGAGRRLTTVRDALVLLGADAVRRFVLLVLLSDIGHGRPALVAAAVLRGRLAHDIARDLGIADPDTAFTAGVLSVVDALVDQPMREVLRGLPLTDELRWALMGRSGPLGAALEMAVRLEHGQAGAAGTAEQLTGALAWADETLERLSA